MINEKHIIIYLCKALVFISITHEQTKAVKNLILSHSFSMVYSALIPEIESLCQSRRCWSNIGREKEAVFQFSKLERQRICFEFECRVISHWRLKPSLTAYLWFKILVSLEEIVDLHYVCYIFFISQIFKYWKIMHLAEVLHDAPDIMFLTTYWQVYRYCRSRQTVYPFDLFIKNILGYWKVDSARNIALH